MLAVYAFLISGLVLLFLGADLLVRGSTRLARLFGISPLIVGLTVVAFGTSAPELFVSLMAAFAGNADVAVGNVIGSNVFNVLMIVGISALVTTVKVPREVKRREMPIMLVVLGLFYWVSVDGRIDRLEGFLLFLGIIAYLLMNYFLARRGLRMREVLELEGETPIAQEDRSPRRIAILIGYVLGGLICMVIGADWIVTNATVVAKSFGVSDLVIGVTLVAVGTSLPELATTVVAAAKNEPELSIGNAVGSNIFNVLCVIGLTSLVTPLAVIDSAISFDLPFMFFSCLAAWPITSLRAKIGRVEGSMLVGIYLIYMFLVFVGMQPGA